jgi:hypothetical protein
VIIRNERIEDDEVSTERFVPVTTPARTILDLARRLPREDALCHTRDQRGDRAFGGPGGPTRTALPRHPGNCISLVHNPSHGRWLVFTGGHDVATLAHRRWIAPADNQHPCRR